MTKVVHDTDLGQTIGVVEGKAEVIEVLNKTKGVVYTDDRGMFSELKDGQTRINTAYIEDTISGQLKQYAVIRMHDSTETLSFDYIKQHFDIAAAEGNNRISIQVIGAVWQFIKSPSGDWTISTHFDASATAAFYGYVRTVNNTANPLFVTHDGTQQILTDPTKDISQYLYRNPRYLRCVDGASATFELVTPMKLRSAEIQLNATISGYVQFPLEMVITYADGSTVTADALPTNSIWYGTDVIDQTKSIASITYTYRADKVIGIPSLLKLSANGTQYSYGMPDFSVTAGDYVQVVNFISIGQHNNFDDKFYPPISDLVDITGEFTITSSVAAAATNPISNLTDGNPTTSFRPSTNAAALTLTATKNATSKTKPAILELSFDNPAGVGNATIQSIVASIVTLATGSNIISNTRWFRNVAGGFVVQILLNSQYYEPFVADRVTAVLTKTSTTQPFSITGFRVLGF